MTSTTPAIRRAIIIECVKLKTHMRLDVQDYETKHRHYLLLHPSNLRLENGDMLTYNNDVVFSALLNDSVSQHPIPRLHLRLNGIETRCVPMAAVLV